MRVFPSSLRVSSMEQAESRLKKFTIPKYRRKELLAICGALFAADPDEGVSTDELMGESGLSPEGVRKAFHDLDQRGIVSNDTALTAFVHAGVQRSSRRRFEQFAS